MNRQSETKTYMLQNIKHNEPIRKHNGLWKSCIDKSMSTGAWQNFQNVENSMIQNQIVFLSSDTKRKRSWRKVFCWPKIKPYSSFTYYKMMILQWKELYNRWCVMCENDSLWNNIMPSARKTCWMIAIVKSFTMLHKSPACELHPQQQSNRT